MNYYKTDIFLTRSSIFQPISEWLGQKKICVFPITRPTHHVLAAYSGFCLLCDSKFCYWGLYRNYIEVNQTTLREVVRFWRKKLSKISAKIYTFPIHITCWLHSVCDNIFKIFQYIEIWLTASTYILITVCLL